MKTKVKIKIIDNQLLRDELDSLYANSSLDALYLYAHSLIDQVLSINKFDTKTLEIINEAKALCTPNTSIKQIRSIGFSLHKFARSQTNQADLIALRVIAQAISTFHMQEHVMVASDYYIKLINLLYPDDLSQVTNARNYQITLLKSFINKNNN